MTEDEMFRWHHRLEGHEFEQTLGDSDAQGSLACCSPWGHKESDVTQRTTTKCDLSDIMSGFFTPMPALVLVDG